ncbi:hypothetical protein GCM10027422_24580 [Hymenobacter arcticus]
MDSLPPTPPIDLGLDIEKMQKMAFILKTTAHPTRIAIVQLLAAHEQLAVTDICERLAAEQSLISHHLATMKSKGILGSSRSGKNIYYSLKMREVINVIQCLAACTFL